MVPAHPFILSERAPDRSRRRGRWNLAGQLAQHLLGAAHPHHDWIGTGALTANHQRDGEAACYRDTAPADDPLAKVQKEGCAWRPLAGY